MSVEKIVEHLPFLDGSGRRRFVAGGIILIGVAAQNPDLFKAMLGMDELEIGDILGSPVIAGGAVLLVYAIGSLAEMLGELSLVRAASGIFLALQFPGKVVTPDSMPSQHWFYRILLFVLKALLFITVVPFMALYLAALGFVGITKFVIDIRQRVSQGAWTVFSKLPESAQRGLHEPVGNETDFAQKFIVDLLQTEPDRKWARRLIIRAKDVAATVTALQVVVLYTLVSLTFEVSGGDISIRESPQFQTDVKAVTEAVKSVRNQNNAFTAIFDLNGIMSAVNQRRELRSSQFPQYKLGRLNSLQRKLEADKKSVRRQLAELDKQTRKIPLELTQQLTRNPVAQNLQATTKAVAERAKKINAKKRSLEVRLAQLNRQTDYKKTLAAVSEPKPAAKIDALNAAMSGYRDYFFTEQERRFLTNLVLTSAWLFFLPLYLGYFTTLRNAIAAILEAIAAAGYEVSEPEAPE